MDETADGHEQQRPAADLAERRSRDRAEEPRDQNDDPEDDHDHPTVGGLIRRVRRRLDVSQRRLADLLDVEASKVARWETGRTSPQVVELEAVLALAGLRLVVIDVHEEVVDPMSEEAVRDRAGRRYPAHADLRVVGWWTPRESWLTPREIDHERRSRKLGDPRISYGLGWLRDLERHFYGMPLDHPTLDELLAELRSWDSRRPRAS